MTTKSLKQTYSPGDIITVINTARYANNIWQIVKVGRRYLHVVNPGWEPDKYNTFRIDTTDTQRLILAGARKEVQESLRNMAEEQRKAREERDRARDRALWDFERTWDDEHPFPENPVLAYIEELRKAAV